MRKPCCEKEMTKKGAWSEEEDTKLITHIRNHGEGNWTSIPQAAGLVRCPKSCRLRWLNYLRPDIKRGDFGEDEEDLILKLHALLGNRWSLIAGRLPGRTDNEVKNYWNSRLRKKLSKKGIDHVKIRSPNSYQKFHHHSPLKDEEMMKPADEKVDDDEKKNDQLPHDDDQEAATNNLIPMEEEEEAAKIDLNLKLSL